MLKSTYFDIDVYFTLAHNGPCIQRKMCKDVRKNLTNMITSKLEEKHTSFTNALIDEIGLSHLRPTCDFLLLTTGWISIDFKTTVS